MNKIVVITPGFPANEGEDFCIPPLQLYVRELVRRGVEVHVVSLEYPFSDLPYLWSGAQVYPCNGQNKRGWKVRTLLRAWNRCKALCAEGTPAIHSFWLGWCAHIGERLSKKYRLPHLTTLMGQDALPQNRMHFWGLNEKRAERLVVLSDFHQKNFEKNTGFIAGLVLPWGIPQREFYRDKTIGRPTDILGVGSLIPLKNWEKWLKTLKIIQKKRPEVRAMLIGEGPLAEKLKSLRAELGLEGSLEFSGPMSRSAVLENMRQARVLLHCSDYESQGYILWEAAANGCALVSTPVGIGPAVCSCADLPEDLAVLVEKALDGPAPEMQPATMESVVDRYLNRFDEITPH